MRTFSQSPHVCCQVCKSTQYQGSISNTVTEARRFRSVPTSMIKHPRSVSCHVPRCSIPSQHISQRMRSNELLQNTFSQKLKMRRKLCCGSCSCRVPVVLGGGIKPGSFRLERTFKRPAGNKRKATMMHVRPRWRLAARSKPQLRTRSHARDREPEGQVEEESTAVPRRNCRGRAGTTKPP